MDELNLKKVIASTAISCGGMIYGGYPRDSILSNHFKERFYQMHPNATQEQFSDASFSPETKDRLVEPTDIDVCFKTENDFHKFVKSLRSNFITVSTDRSSEYSFMKCEASLSITPRTFVSSTKIQNLEVKEMMIKVLNSVFGNSTKISDSVYIDVKIGNISCILDFDVNTLVMTKDGISVYGSHDTCHVKKFMDVSNIIENIKHKKATSIILFDNRWKKMYDKGWNLYGFSIHRLILSDEECILCKQDIDDSRDAYRFPCCNATYHASCMLHVIEDMEKKCKYDCIHCREFLSPLVVHNKSILTIF